MGEVGEVGPVGGDQLDVVAHLHHELAWPVTLAASGADVFVVGLVLTATDTAQHRFIPLPGGQTEEFEGAGDRGLAGADVANEHLIGQGGLVVAAVGEAEEVIGELGTDEGADVELAGVAVDALVQGGPGAGFFEVLVLIEEEHFAHPARHVVDHPVGQPCRQVHQRSGHALLGRPLLLGDAIRGQLQTRHRQDGQTVAAVGLGNATGRPRWREQHTRGRQLAHRFELVDDRAGGLPKFLTRRSAEVLGVAPDHLQGFECGVIDAAADLGRSALEDLVGGAQSPGLGGEHHPEHSDDGGDAFGFGGVTVGGQAVAGGGHPGVPVGFGAEVLVVVGVVVPVLGVGVSDDVIRVERTRLGAGAGEFVDAGERCEFGDELESRQRPGGVQDDTVGAGAHALVDADRRHERLTGAETADDRGQPGLLDERIFHRGERVPGDRPCRDRRGAAEDDAGTVTDPVTHGGHPGSGGADRHAALVRGVGLGFTRQKLTQQLHLAVLDVQLDRRFVHLPQAGNLVAHLFRGSTHHSDAPPAVHTGDEPGVIVIGLFDDLLAHLVLLPQRLRGVFVVFDGVVIELRFDLVGLTLHDLSRLTSVE